ncbi:hypothetical protein PM082_013298 [Marasmius tenuissimus]|nr:hypothetical protein PM082_013298 [Marasmius tenuissimus]
MNIFGYDVKVWVPAQYQRDLSLCRSFAPSTIALSPKYPLKSTAIPLVLSKVQEADRFLTYTHPVSFNIHVRGSSDYHGIDSCLWGWRVIDADDYDWGRKFIYDVGG